MTMVILLRLWMSKDSKGIQRDATECLRMLSDDKECYRSSKAMIKHGTRC